MGMLSVDDLKKICAALLEEFVCHVWVGNMWCVFRSARQLPLLSRLNQFFFLPMGSVKEMKN